jgi:hypothetical protein
MNSYQLGKVGITIVGLGVAVHGLAGGVMMLTTAFSTMAIVESTSLRVFSLVILLLSALGFSLLFGLLPGALLILWRRELSRRWCASDDPTNELAVSGTELLRVGLLLLGVYLVVLGVVYLPESLVSVGASAWSEEPAAALGALLGGTVVGSLVKVGAGWFLIRRSRSLAEAWMG